ncbi:MAG: hypothetical protein PHQ43_02435, partial [Dehalococcoidales bacterium]|nr:hypothetical protein [Dehalococcoidales bacterium]
MDRFSAKQPDEEYYVLFDFGNVIGTDTVSSATVTAIDLDDDSDVSDTILDATSQTESGQYVYVWVQ